jgi:hypothetical protein
MRLISIFLLSLLLSCSRVVEYPSVTVTEYAIGGQLRRTETDRLRIDSTKYDKTYRYIRLDMPDSLFHDLVKQDSRTDSIIIYYTEPCNLRGQMTFSFGDNKYEIKRYILDSPMTEDDAGAIFFLDGYGIIAIKSIDWGVYSFFDRGHDYSRFIIESLKSDTSEFFGRIPRGKTWESSD